MLCAENKNQEPQMRQNLVKTKLSLKGKLKSKRITDGSAKWEIKALNVRSEN